MSPSFCSFSWGSLLALLSSFTPRRFRGVHGVLVIDLESAVCKATSYSTHWTIAPAHCLFCFLCFGGTGCAQGLTLTLLLGLPQARLRGTYRVLGIKASGLYAGQECNPLYYHSSPSLFSVFPPFHPVTFPIFVLPRFLCAVLWAALLAWELLAGRDGPVSRSKSRWLCTHGMAES